MKALLFVALLSLATGVLGGSDVYTFKDKNNRYCLILDVDFEGSIQYSTKDNKTQEYKFNVTKAFPEQEGNCHTTFNKSLSANVITIKFHPNDITPAVPESQNYWEIDLTFVDRADKNEIELADYKLSAYFFPSVFKDAAELTHEYVKDPSAENTIHWAKADKVYKAYQCSSAGVSFEKESKLSLNNLKVTAFANLDTAEIPKDMDVEKCPMDIRTSDIVPIVVGACLAGLVIIVLVAYLIGRARAKRQGYATYLMLICRRIALLTPAARFYSTAGSWRNNKECQVEVQGDASTKFRTGHLARFADGAVVASTGDTAVLATVVSDAPSNSDGGVPLIVDFKQSASAIGRIPTNYLRREMQQSDADIIASRIIDRSLRPLFPDRFNMPVQITCKPLSVAEDGDPVILGLNAASAALSISNIPWLGPVAAVRVGLVDDKIVINPARDIMKSSKLDLLVSGCHDRKVVMIEMDGQQISEDKILECFDTALTRIRDLLSGIEKLCNEVGKEKKIHNPVVNEALEKQVATLAGSRLYYIFKDFDHDKVSRDNAVKEVLEDVFRELDKSPQVAVAFSRLSKEVFRGIVTDEGWRCDGRSLTEFRPINSEVNLYNKLHGSAIFQRGQTQVMGTLTFDSPSAAFHPDSVSQLLGAQRKKMFMLHYEFPGFATNEVSTSRGVNRREMGHGMLAEKALKHVIPEDFPYSLRLACQVLESNGSSSMASACVGSLALMDAGVKILNPVAGAAIGLIKDEPSGKHTLLTDILGIEDYMGDMDFKVAGTREGFTAMQLDLKIKGLPMDVLGEALRRGSDGISHVLGKMAETLPEPRATFKDSVPVITSIDMPSFQRSILFRSGGYNVKLIEAETGVKVEQEDDKRIALIAPTAALLEEAQGMIKKMLSEGTELELDFGRIYEMKIVEICETGIKVSAKDGTRPFFVYNRELDQRNVAHASALGLKVGDKIRVSYYGRDPATGGQRLSCKRVAYGGATAAVTDLNRRR